MSTVSCDLSQTELFRNLPDAMLEIIQANAKSFDLLPGDLLLSPERENHYIYLLLQGSLGVYFGSLNAPEAKVLQPGASVGELSIIDQNIPSAYVVAKEASRVFQLHGDVIRDLIADANPVVRNLIGVLIRWIRANTESMGRDIVRIDELSNHAMTDQLTGLYNRRWLDNALELALAKAKETQEPLCVLMIDVDRFKQYNDNFGHLAGDQVLVAVAKYLKTGRRAFHYAARFGGEEFMILLPNTPVNAGIAVAERIRTSIQKLRIESPNGAVLPGITLSIGLVVNAPDSTCRSIVQAADAKLYQAKQEGRDCVRY